MPKIALTDLSIQKLKSSDKQKTYWDTNFPSFGIRISKRSKSFVVMYGRDRKLKTLGRYPSITLKMARKDARKVLLSIDSYSNPQNYKEAVLDFLEDIKGRVRKNTSVQYELYLTFFNFKGKVSEITKTDITNKLSELEGKPVAQNVAYSNLRAFFNWCLRNEYIDKHPLLALSKPNRITKRDRVLSEDELHVIWLATAPNIGAIGRQTYNKLVRILMLTGQRRTEIVRLTPERVVGALTFPDTKNHTTHTIPLTPLVKKHLTVPFYFNNWGDEKTALNKRCGMSDWVIHDLRRTFSTNMARLGIPIHITERILNHRSGSVSGIVETYNRYSYLPEMEQALLQYEAFIEKIVNA